MNKDEIIEYIKTIDFNDSRFLELKKYFLKHFLKEHLKIYNDDFGEWWPLNFFDFYIFEGDIIDERISICDDDNCISNYNYNKEKEFRINDELI